MSELKRIAHALPHWIKTRSEKIHGRRETIEVALTSPRSSRTAEVRKPREESTGERPSAIERERVWEKPKGQSRERIGDVNVRRLSLRSRSLKEMAQRPLFCMLCFLFYDDLLWACTVLSKGDFFFLNYFRFTWTGISPVIFIHLISNLALAGACPSRQFQVRLWKEIVF